jgi:dTDP-4-dehydrorhamnose reductase
MKVIVLGKGFISQHLPYETITNRLEASPRHFEQILDTYKPDVIVNCVGKTGRPNVDWCESHREETAVANVALPIMLAEVCAKKSIHFIQVGSGCIYFGQSPHTEWTNIDDGNLSLGGFSVDHGWEETDFANPQSFYSQTKYACDLAIGSMPNVTTLRIRMPISEKAVDRNLINKLRGYQQVIDIPNSMTFMTDFTSVVGWVIEKSQTGIFHVANPEPLSPARIMREYQKWVPHHQFKVIDEAQLEKLTIAKRSNCTLNTDKLTQAGFRMTPSEEALSECMKNYMDKHYV